MCRSPALIPRLPRRRKRTADGAYTTPPQTRAPSRDWRSTHSPPGPTSGRAFSHTPTRRTTKNQSFCRHCDPPTRAGANGSEGGESQPRSLVPSRFTLIGPWSAANLPGLLISSLLVAALSVMSRHCEWRSRASRRCWSMARRKLDRSAVPPGGRAPAGISFAKPEGIDRIRAACLGMFGQRRE